MGYDSRVYVIESPTSKDIFKHNKKGEIVINKKFQFQYKDTELNKERPNVSNSDIYDLEYGETIATIEMCGTSLINLFVKEGNPLMFRMYMDDGNTLITEDEYGEIPKIITVKRAIEFLEESTAEKDFKYRREIMLLDLLKSFTKENGWIADMFLVHYGH